MEKVSNKDILTKHNLTVFKYNVKYRRSWLTWKALSITAKNINERTD